ncbi:YjcQ family protein [Clostridium sp. HBUAS56010]|uniref:YjcQ family protein n=1 Tax=Clostridium sp. HBUAS56010 TaxID=2571127 RepID=UPI0011784C17|nr:YjcQ family protein [Clostridium sp. HBUAS56010]
MSTDEIMKKIIRGIKDGNYANPSDIGLDGKEYSQVIEDLQEEGYIKGAIVAQLGSGVILQNATVTLKGRRFIEE